MAITYLALTNELLKELNEVQLTSTNFSSAVGIHAFVKDTVNRAYLDIVNGGDEWPFLNTGLPADPFSGSTYIETVAGQRWYLLKDASAGVNTDFDDVDWDNFYLTDYGVAGATAPYENNNLKYITQADWIQYYRTSENSDIFSGNPTYGVPKRVMASPDARQFGLSPTPDGVYRIYFNAWERPSELSAFDDTIVFPDQYKTVLLARARYYMWQFKESPQQAGAAMQEFIEGIRVMRRNLLGPGPDYVSDDRTFF